MRVEYEKLKSILLNVEEDVKQADAGNKSAGRRVRKVMQEVKKTAQEVRKAALIK